MPHSVDYELTYMVFDSTKSYEIYNNATGTLLINGIPTKNLPLDRISLPWIKVTKSVSLDRKCFCLDADFYLREFNIKTL